MTEGGEEVASEHGRGNVQRAASASPTPSSQNGEVIYSSVTTRVTSDFQPSRRTRPSTNPALQDQGIDVRTAMEQRGLAKCQASVLGTKRASHCETLRGQYAEVEFLFGARQPEGNNGVGESTDTRNSNVRRRAMPTSVFGLERSAIYENLVAPTNGELTALWVGRDHSVIPVPASSAENMLNSKAMSEEEEEGSEDAGDSEQTTSPLALSASASPPPQSPSLSTMEELQAACYSVPGRKQAMRTMSCESNSSVRSSDYDEVPDTSGYSTVANGQRGNDCALSASRSNSLNCRRRTVQRKRCVTPVCTSPAPNSKVTESSRRHYEDTDLVTGLPLDLSPPPSSAASPTPSFPWSPTSRDVFSSEHAGTGILHSRSSSAPDPVSPLSDDTPATNPVSPLAQELLSPDQIRRTRRALPEPPQRHSSLYARSQSTDSLVMRGTGHRRQASVDGAPPLLPPKTRRRLNTTAACCAGVSSSVSAAAAAAAAGPTPGTSANGDARNRSSYCNEDMICADVHQLRAECSSPASVTGSACSSPEPVNVETLPSRESWRKSSALEVFGNFQLQFIGQKEVECAYGAVNGAMETLLRAESQNPYNTVPCIMNVTAVAVEVSGDAGLCMRHQVDSVETIAPYSGNDVIQSNNRQCVMAYVVVEEGVSATCFVFRSASQTTRNTVLNTIESALYADVKQFKSMTYPRHVVNADNNTSTHSSQFSVKHIGSIAVSSAYNSIDEAGRQLLSHTHPAKVPFTFMDLDFDRIRLRKTTANVIFASHLTHAISSVGSFSEDCRVFGYVVRQRAAPCTHICHLFRCSRPTCALAILDCIKDACQDSYMHRRKFTDGFNSSDDEKVSSGGFRGFLSRKISSRASSERKQGSGRHKSASTDPEQHEQQLEPLSAAGVSQSKDSMMITELSESPPVRRHTNPVEHPSSDAATAYTLHYLGTGTMQQQTLSPPRAMTSMVMQNFRNFGMEAGAVPYGSVDVKLRVSSQGVTLSDVKKVMFIQRNYPRRTVFHVDQHLADKDLFSFATLPSPNLGGNVGQLKVHVFRSTANPGSSVVGLLRGILEH